MTVTRLHQVEGPGAAHAHVIEGRAVIGRDRRADVRLSDPTVSREHAELQIEGVTVVVTDLGSSNGTEVNGEPIEDPRRLKDGDRIRVGDTELQLRIETGEAEAATPAEPTRVRHAPD